MSTSTLQSIRKRQHIEEVIHFSEDDLSNMMKPHEDSLVIIVDICPNTIVEKVIINSRSSVDMLYNDVFIKMGHKRENLSPLKVAIYCLTNIATLIEGVVTLKTSITSKKGQVSLTPQFIIVEVKSSLKKYLDDHSFTTLELYPHHIINAWDIWKMKRSRTYMNNSWILTSLTKTTKILDRITCSSEPL